MKKLHIAFLVASFIIPSISLASIDTNLKYGSHGVAVTELQDFLIEKGFLAGRASGNFFSLTRKAVVAYQSSVGLPATGYVGPMTRTKINADLLSANASSVSAEIAETGATPAHTSISNTATPVQANTTTLPLVSGCTSNVGFSSTTGKRCSDTSTTAIPTTNKTIILATGAIVEIDTLGNIVRTITPAPVISPVQSNIPTVTTSAEIQISSINITPSITSAKIEWQTDKLTESKVFISSGSLYSRVLNSESGLSTRHMVSTSGLSSGTTYSYEIEAIIQGVVAKKIGSFSTDSYKPTIIAFIVDAYHTLPTSSLGGGCQQNRFYVGVKDQFGSFMNDQLVSFSNPETQEIISRKTNNRTSNGDNYFADFVYAPQIKSDTLKLNFSVGNPPITPPVSVSTMLTVSPLPDSMFSPNGMTTDESGKSYLNSTGQLVDPVNKVCI